MNDLVDHIRTVHFTVLIVAFVLAAALQIERRRPLERADDDAEAILHLSERWPETTTAIMKQLDLQGSEDHLHYPSISNSAVVLPSPAMYRAHVKANGRRVYNVAPYVFVTKQRWAYLASEATRLHPSLGFAKSWETLDDFLKFWDNLHNGKSAYVPIVLSEDAKSGFTCGDLTRASTYDPIETVLTDIVFAGSRSATEKFQVWKIMPFLRELKPLDTDTAPGRAVMCDFQELDLVPETLDLGRVLSSVDSRASKWGNRSTSEEFSELISASKDFETAPLPNLAQSLRERANTDTERIELFQAKLPASAIPTYGSLILVLCEFYLLAHLLELRRVLRNVSAVDWPTGYIGLYRAWAVFGFTILSLTAFPLVPLLISASGNAGIVRYLSIIACIASLLLGLGCSWVLLTIRREAEHELPAA